MTRLVLTTAVTTLLAAGLQATDHPLMPCLVGDWWTVATDPDLGPLTKPSQQPVDFGIWQAADGTWQIWSCIRGTKETAHTRLFHSWEGEKLTDANWAPKGIALQANPALGETAGGLQAPYVIRHQDQYWMFYGDWVNICLATSTDGKAFTRHRNAEGRPQLDFAGNVDRNRNSRDPMVPRIRSKWFCYYTAHPGNKGFDFARTSDDLIHWSEECIVATRGKSGDGPYSAECPFVVEPQPGHFYLFRTQRYGKDAHTMVYYSRNPLDFGIDNDAEHYVTTLPVAAPEIFQHEGQWYLAALLPTLKGIQITRMEWVPKVIKVDAEQNNFAIVRTAETQAASLWRSLPLITNGRVDEGWCHVGWGGFAVDDGALRTECDPKGLGLLVYKRERFGNCQIRVVFKCKDAKSNAGVFVRIDDGILAQTNQPGAAFDRNEKGKISAESMKRMMTSGEREEGPWFAVHRGYEVQIMDENDEFHRTGAIYSLAASSAVSRKAPGERKTMVITLAGNRIFVDLEGQRITRFDPASADLPRNRQWFEPKREPTRPEVGYLGLQNHDPGDIVWFKEVSVRPLLEVETK